MCAWVSHAHEKKNTKKAPPRGLGAVLIFFYPKSYFFCDLKLHAKFQNPRTTPAWRKVCGPERKENNLKNSGHFVPQQRLRAAHALRSDQFLWSGSWLAGRLSENNTILWPILNPIGIR